MEILNDAKLTIARIAPLIRRRRLSPVELTHAILDRIERLGPGLNAFITVTADLAVEQARCAEKEISRKRYRGPLHGIPFSLKDLFYTEGIRTTAGSRILRRFTPLQNAPVVDRLFEAGCVLVGKTNLHEFAYGATNVNPHFGLVRNPWDRSRISGGSSGGSAAAVTAGLSLASLGTDTGGSIRIPAAACGCVGLKPTYGRVSLQGVIPLAGSLDHVGPICRCVEDAALVLDCIAGTSTAKTLKAGLRGLRVGVPKQYFFSRLQRDVRRSVLAAIDVLTREGARAKQVELKFMRETAMLASEITAAEALVYHWKWLSKRPADYGPDVRSRMEKSVNGTALAYLTAQKLRQDYTRAFEEALEAVDVLAVPTLPVVAPRIEDSEVRIGRGKEDVRLALLRLTRPGNLTGLPALSVPCGFTAAGLPVGLQLIGRCRDEATILRVGFAFEQATPWHLAFPSDLSGA